MDFSTTAVSVGIAMVTMVVVTLAVSAGIRRSHRPRVLEALDFGDAASPQQLSELAFDHLAGGAISVSNASAKPGGASGTERLSRLIHGFERGASGPSMGRH